MEAYPLLDLIQDPSQIKTLSHDVLLELCKELRRRIIQVMSVNGGHLASNLGVVELTVALHRIFDAPSDKFIWDVSHQTYPHKLLTGRHEGFESIRKFQGLCGFSNPKESPYDHFHAGHAGTALSLALGLATTRDLRQETFHVLPILGDASLTCGVTLEAMNNVHRDLGRLVVVLNDNAMSISKNVGAITGILSRLLNNPTCDRFYRDLNKLVGKIPHLGDRLAKHSGKITESLRNLVSPAAFFEQFGLSYWGPFDGHDLHKILDVLEAVKETPYPVLLHVLTNKGQGIEEAVKNPITYHGVKPFDPTSYKFLPTKSAPPTFPKIFGRHLLQMADEDATIVAVTPAMSLGSCLDEFMTKYPNRCLDVGIAESHAITFCGGLAYGGQQKVVASIYASFLQRALDNLFHDVCLQELPVVFAIDRAGLAGADGVTHNGIYDIAFLRSMPNMVIAQPRNGHILKELLSSAFDWGLPTAIRYPNLPTGEYEAPIKRRQLGKGEILAKGRHLLIIPLGHLCETAAEVRQLLLDHRIEATIFDPIFVKPLDKEQLRGLLSSHSKVVTLEEHTLAGGLGAEVNQFLVEERRWDVEILNIGVPDLFVEQGNHAALWDSLGLSAPKVAERVLQTFYAFETHELKGSVASHENRPIH